MLDQNDLKQIRTIIKENNNELTKEIVLQVGEFITDHVLPQIDGLHKEVTEVKKTVTTLPNKDFLSRGLADVKGTLVAQLRTEDQKVNLLITFLKEKNVLNDQQWKALQELKVFPAIDIA